MKKIYSLLFLVFGFCVSTLYGQVTTSPTPLQQSSQNVKVYFHANQGDQGLMGVGANTAVFAHTWAVLSNGQQVGAPNWNSTYPDKYKLIYVSPNLWQLNIGDIRSFYGVTDPNVRIEQLGFVFRNADASRAGRAEGGADIMVDVVDEGLQVSLQANITNYLITPYTGSVSFTAYSTESASLAISVNGTNIATGSGTSLTGNYTFSTPGDYTVTATATANGSTVSATKEYCYVKASTPQAYPGGGTPQMGPTRNADGSVTFCVGAPDKHSMMIVGAWNDYAIENDQVMYYTDVDNLRYFWITIPGLANDTMYGYYFIVDGSTPVGDPYARLVLDPWNDKYLSTDVFPDLPAYPYDKIDGIPLAVYQGNINDYNWQVKNFVGPKPENLVIYEMLLRDFTGTEGQALGNGTVRQAMEKIGYLKQLGVNAIELLPIMEFNGNNSWGYNPNFYFAVDKAYGTPDDYKEFIDLCHQNGMAVILDMVFNQSDGLHPWYMMYTPGQNPFYNLNAPHAYSVLNDWNQGNPMVQQQWKDVLQYWLTEYKFDGFRFDLVKGLGNNDSYSNNGDAATNAYNQSRIDRMLQFQQIVKAINPNAYCINEDLAGADEENAMAEYGMLNWANVNDAACQFAMGYSTNSNMNRLYAPNDSKRLWGSTVSYLESHDEQRLAYKQNEYGLSAIKGNVVNSMLRCGSAAAQMLMTPGAHMIWQFSEMGNAQNTKTSTGGNNTDPKVVNWNLLDEPNHKGLYDNYCELIFIRNNNPEMFADYATFSMACNTSNWSGGRTLSSVLEDKELYTFVNPMPSTTITMRATFKYPSNDNYQIMSQSYNTNPTFNAAAGTVTIPPNSYVVIGSKALAGVGDVTTDAPNSALEAYGVPGGITILNSVSPVEVYTTAGLKVAYAATPTTLSLQPGIYIVRSGSETQKVMAR